MDIEKLKFPVGQYIPIRQPDKALLDQWIAIIEHFPEALEKLTAGKPAEHLNWKYRPDGWTVKQVVHHCADSHMNSMIRFKLALTEETPTIRPYFEDRWAELADGLTTDISASMQLLKGLHQKWALLLKRLADEDLELEFVHPEHGTKFNLAETIGMYAWHCKHHLAHVENGLNSGGAFN